MITESYTSLLNSGIGMINETQTALDIWQPGMSASDLIQVALKSGQFPNITARRLRNFVFECFKHRYLVNDGSPAVLLKSLKDILSPREFNQVLFIFTSRADAVLRDFVNEVYWNSYSSGRDMISNEDAREFVRRANQDGKTLQPWSDNTVMRVARYLTLSCADFGLLESGTKVTRKILPYHVETRVAILLAYELHFSGLGDNSVVGHRDWALFGMDRADVLNELKRLAPQGWFIIQAAGDVTRIAWQYKNMEELVHALAQ